MERPRERNTLRTMVWLTLGSVLVACGSGDDSATEAAGGDATAYCEQVEVLESQDSSPSDQQLDELIAAAPAEIRADVEVFADAIRTHDMEAEGVSEAESRILAWEEENCS